MQTNWPQPRGHLALTQTHSGDLAFAAFSEAVAARVAARIEYAKAELAEDAAEAKLAAALKQMEASDTPVASSS